GVFVLRGVRARVVAPAGPRLLDDLVLDPLFVQGLLDTPARVTGRLDPQVLAAVKLDRHQLPPLGRMSVTPSRTLSITEVTRGSDLTCSLKALIARVPSSLSASSRTRPLHTLFSTAINPPSVSP